jgi:4-hydroxybenzoyl-CoA reductase subunit beta
MESLPPFVLARPATLSQAALLLTADRRARIVAGGTDLVPNLRDGLGEPSVLVDLSSIAGLDRISVTADGATIGAGATLARLASHVELHEALPILAEAALAIAAPGHRTVATVGGNLCLDTRCVFYNQSAWWRRANDHCLKHGGDTCHVAPHGRRCHAAFAGDLAPALLVLGAEIDLVGSRGSRRIALERLYADDGAAHLTLAPGEIVVGVRAARPPPGARGGYRKARARGAIDFPLAGVAALVSMRDGEVTDLRVALTGTNSRPFLLEGTAELTRRPLDDATLARLGKLVQQQVSPMRTTVTASNYRRQVAAVLAQRLVRELAG